MPFGRRKGTGPINLAGPTTNNYAQPLARRSSVDGTIRIQNSVWDSQYRVVAQYSAIGPSEFIGTKVFDYEPPSGRFPLLRSRFTLRPGHNLVVFVTTAPWSDGWDPGRAIVAKATLDNGTATWSVEEEVSIPQLSTYQTELEGLDSSFSRKHLREAFTVLQTTRQNNLVGGLEIMGGIDCHIEVTALIYHRVYDITVVEVPFFHASRSSDRQLLAVSHDAERSSNAYAAITNTTNDYRAGQRAIHDIMVAQRRMMGPILSQWQGRIEANDDSHWREGVPLEGSRNVLDRANAQTEYNAARAGMSVNCGSHAREYIQNNMFVARGRSYSVPVSIWVYIIVNSTSSFHLRFATGKASYVDMHESITASGWSRVYGYLQVDPTPGSNRLLQAICMSVTSSASDADHVNWPRIACVTVEYLGGRPRWRS